MSQKNIDQKDKGEIKMARFIVPEKTTIQKEIDIELPYYYKHNLMLDDDSVIYGKIEEHQHTAIQLTLKADSKDWEWNIENNLGSPSDLLCYMNSKYQSNEEEFLQIKQKLIEAVKVL